MVTLVRARSLGANLGQTSVGNNHPRNEDAVDRSPPLSAQHTPRNLIQPTSTKIIQTSGENKPACAPELPSFSSSSSPSSS